jgi:peptidoglycan hydrolase CwlO-like protein
MRRVARRLPPGTGRRRAGMARRLGVPRAGAVLRAALGGALIVTASWLHPVPAHADPIANLQKRYQEAIGQAQRKLNEWNARRQQQEAVVEQLRGATTSYAAELRRIDADLLQTVNRLRQAEADLARIEAEIQDLERQMAEKQAAVEQRARAYSTRLRGLYKFTRTSPLEQLLAARDFSDALRRITMMQAVAQVDRQLLGQLRNEHRALVEARAGLAQRQAEATTLRDEIRRQRQTLEARRAEQSALVARAQEQQRQAEAALDEFERQRQEQAAQIAALQAQMQR